MRKLIQQGAEAKIFLDDGVILKDRISKTYRHPSLDEKIRIRRTRSEAKILGKAVELRINVPNVFDVNKFQLRMEFIDGEKLSDTLNYYDNKKQQTLMRKFGKQVSLLHKNNIIHGDLTTSNVILKNKEIFVIDFGLGFISQKIEDKAVDLHLIKQALEAKHFQNYEELFANFVKGYSGGDSGKVIERLKIVERRGRYKH